MIDPDGVIFTVQDPLGVAISTYSGSDLTETKVDVDGDTYCQYSTTRTLQKRREHHEYALNDSIQTAVDTATITAKNRLT